MFPIFVRVTTAITAMLFALVFSAAAIAGPVNASGGLGIKGYDPVAYFSGGAKKGSSSISAKHDGVTYRFSSEANKAKFQSNPAKYLPAYGGYCAWGLSQGYKAPIDPQAFTVHGGKLYLNYSKSVRANWNKDRSGHIKTANMNWPKIKNQ